MSEGLKNLGFSLSFSEFVLGKRSHVTEIERIAKAKSTGQD